MKALNTLLDCLLQHILVFDLRPPQDFPKMWRMPVEGLVFQLGDAGLPLE